MSITIGIKNWLKIAESNESLMLKYADTGELKFIKELVKRLENDLYQYIYTHAGPDLASDLCQTAWEKLIKNRRSYSETGTVKSWLFKIARTTMIDELRRQQRWQYDDLDENALPLTSHNADNALDVLTTEQRQAAFDYALEQLPFFQREAFSLQQEGFRLREISQITQSEMETVKSRLRYAKQTLVTLMLTNQEGE